MFLSYPDLSLSMCPQVRILKTKQKQKTNHQRGNPSPPPPSPSVLRDPDTSAPSPTPLFLSGPLQCLPAQTLTPTDTPVGAVSHPCTWPEPRRQLLPAPRSLLPAERPEGVLSRSLRLLPLTPAPAPPAAPASPSPSPHSDQRPRPIWLPLLLLPVPPSPQTVSVTTPYHPACFRHSG